MLTDNKTIAVADCETDPFRNGYPVHPFVWGFYDGSQYQKFWGSDCNQQFLRFLSDYENPLCIYGHNAGKFDWYFLSEYFRGNIRLIGTRVVQAYIGRHELRDSFANIPVPLRDFLALDGGKKGEIDYQIMRPSKRENPRNKRKILSYLKDDCLVLYDGIMRYRSMFGNSLTMASASMKKLNEVSTGDPNDTVYERLTPRQDFEFRKYYYGGRVECFKSGVITGDLKLYDVTSMYPHVMASYKHPVSASFSKQIGKACHITDQTDFVRLTCESHGALPVRGKFGLHFPYGTHEFFATGAEVRQALDLGLITIHKIHETITASERVSFREFVTHFFSLRAEAKQNQDVMLNLFYKLVLNSAYGKFAQNPLAYMQLIALAPGEYPDGDLWNDPDIKAIREHEIEDGPPCDCANCFRKRNAWNPLSETDHLSIWQKPTSHARQSFLNVATASSITGYSRSVLMKGLANADDPIYCDTDCVVTRGNFSADIGNKLGQWKLECYGSEIAIAGKKMYVMYGEIPTSETEQKERITSYGDARVVKLASKGVRIGAREIYAVASGQEITHRAHAPIFKIDGRQLPLTRTISNTARVEPIL